MTAPAEFVPHSLLHSAIRFMILLTVFQKLRTVRYIHWHFLRLGYYWSQTRLENASERNKVDVTAFEYVRNQWPERRSRSSSYHWSWCSTAVCSATDHRCKKRFFTFFTSMPRTYISRYGPFSFRLSAPTAWTELKDSDISRTQVKSGRKTWLFERA